MGAEKVFASTVRPGWKSSQADRPGKESVPISDPNSAKSQENVRVNKANPESKVEVCKPASVPSLADENVCDANPKYRMSESKSNPSMEKCVCCQVCMKNVAKCVCQAESNSKSRKVISKTKLIIRTTSVGKFTERTYAGSSANYHLQI